MCSLSTSHPQPWVINKGGIISLQGLSHQLCKHAIHSPTLRKASFSPPTPNPISQPLFLGKKKKTSKESPIVLPFCSDPIPSDWATLSAPENINYLHVAKPKSLLSAYMN